MVMLLFRLNQQDFLFSVESLALAQFYYLPYLLIKPMQIIIYHIMFIIRHYLYPWTCHKHAQRFWRGKMLYNITTVTTWNYQEMRLVEIRAQFTKVIIFQWCIRHTLYFTSVLREMQISCDKSGKIWTERTVLFLNSHCVIFDTTIQQSTVILLLIMLLILNHPFINMV